MRTCAICVLLLVVAGCATVRQHHELSFANAVRDSLQIDPKYQVVLIMDKGGSLSIAGRPVTMEELKAIPSVEGLPKNPPGVLIWIHPDANPATVDAVAHELSIAGMYTIRAAVLKHEEDWHNKASPDNRNLQGPPLGYDNQCYSHSRQFRSNVVDEKGYYEHLITDGGF